MKKILIILLIFIQLNAYSITKGLKGGINYTIPQPLSKYSEDFSGDFGYNLGGFLTFNVINNFYFNTELIYNSYWFKYDIGENKNNGNDNFKTLDLTLSLMYNFFDNAYFNIGIFLGYPLDYEGKYFDAENNELEYNPGPDYREPTYGLLFGFMYKYNKILFDLRYLYNFSSVLSKENYEAQSGGSCNNSSDTLCKFDKFHHIQLLIGYEF